jgi:large subunit ribosomal protein L29
MTARAVALDNLRALTSDELAAHLREQRGQLFQVRLQQTIGQVENHRQIRAIRKEIAQTMTVQVELRLAAERGESPPAPSVVATPSRGRRRAAATEAATEVAVEVAAEEPAAAAAPVRTRRPRKAAIADEPASSADVPVEEAISDVVVERVDPADDASAPDAGATETTKDAGATKTAADNPTTSAPGAGDDEDEG